jgi:WD40 repeat protein
LAFSPDGRLLASGSTDRSVVVADLTASEQAPRTLARHASWVYALAFDPSGAILASGSRDGTVLLWDVASGEPLGAALSAPTGNVFSLAFSPDGGVLASGSAGPETFVVWDVALASWQAHACRIANRNLAMDEWERFVGQGVPYRCTCPALSPGEEAPLDACATGR